MWPPSLLFLHLLLSLNLLGTQTALIQGEAWIEAVNSVGPPCLRAQHRLTRTIELLMGCRLGSVCAEGGLGDLGE